MGWNMRAMFFGASSFNQPLCGWWVQQVRTMQAMFHGAESMVEPNVLYSAFRWFRPTRGRLADQWWADKEAMEKDKDRPRWQLGGPCRSDFPSEARFTGVVVAYEIREVELSEWNRDAVGRWKDTKRRFYFVQGEDGNNLLLHECELVSLGDLAVGDRISYAVGPSRFNAVYTHYRLECTHVWSPSGLPENCRLLVIAERIRL